ncbi:MAG TPA: hypothetical protein PKB14_24995 [Rubrivivax sp.]|nr:hypothetical protein [Rubrivivax sp.]
MSATPSAEDTAAWQRRLAAQANNRAWDLAEASKRTPGEDEDMLQAAHAAMFFWKRAGDAGRRAHAAQLLAHVYALLRLPNPARHYLAQSQPHFLSQPCAAWEQALAHAVAAHVAAAAHEPAAHAQHRDEALRLAAALDNAEERDMLDATLRVVPDPRGDTRG